MTSIKISECSDDSLNTMVERIFLVRSGRRRRGVAHFHHRFHRVIHLPAPWLGKKYLIPSQGAGICGTFYPARGAWGMRYLIPSQGRWALVVPHPQPGGRHVKYFFPHWASCGPHGVRWPSAQPAAPFYNLTSRHSVTNARAGPWRCGHPKRGPRPHAIRA